MAVKLLVPRWNHAAGTIVRDLPAEVERDLAASGMVSWHLEGGSETTAATTWDGVTQIDRALAMRDEVIPALLVRPQTPTAADTHPAGTRWLDSVTGTFYETTGGGAWQSGGGTDTATVQALIDASQPSRGFPVSVTGTTEVLACPSPCDLLWVAHSSTAAATITLRDAGTISTGIAATQTIAMGSTGPLVAGNLRTQYGLTVQLSAGSATVWVVPL